MRCAAEDRPHGRGRAAPEGRTVSESEVRRKAHRRGARASAWSARGGSRKAAACCVMVLAVTCLLAACTGSPPGARSGGAGSRALPPGHGFIGHPRVPPRLIIISGPGGGGASAIFIGGTGGAGSRPKITMPPIPPVGSSLTVPMPLEAYQAISTQQQEALADASALLIQRCMAARGFEDTSSANPPFSSVATLEQVETSGAGLTSITQARTFGFVRPKNTGSSPSGPQIIGFVGAVSFGQSLKAGHGYAEALYGFGPGTGPGGHLGCWQQASKEVYGPIVGEPVPDPVPQIAAQAVGFTQSDPRIHAVDRAWSRCMARRFYHYSTPQQAEHRQWRTPPNKAEIATAIADVTCKTQTNLLNTWLAVQAAYQQALIGQNLATLAQLQANFAPLLRRANANLAATA